MNTEPEKMRCDECGEEWVDEGTGVCPFCGSNEVWSVNEDEEGTRE